MGSLNTRSPNGRFRLVYGQQSGPAGWRRMLRALTLMLDDLFGYTEFFEYQLWERGGWLPVWQRRQPKSETNPSALHVSDTGYSVIVTAHRLEFIALDPQGKELLRLEIGPPRDRRQTWLLPGKARPVSEGWAVFFQHEGRLHFAWRFPGGDRVVLRIGPDTTRIDPDEALSAACRAAEEASVIDYIARRGQKLPAVVNGSWTDRLPGGAGRRQAQCQRLRQALLLVLGHRLHPALPLLRRLERCRPGEWRSLPSLGAEVSCGGGLRPLIQQALRRLGQTPLNLPAYQFKPLEADFPPDRSRRLAAFQSASPLEALHYLGSPDFIEVGESLERWEYDSRGSDGGWLTTRLEWNGPELVSLARGPSDWTEREANLT